MRRPRSSSATCQPTRWSDDVGGRGQEGQRRGQRRRRLPSSPERAAELANVYAETAQSQARADQRRRTLATLQSVTRQLSRLSPEAASTAKPGRTCVRRQNTLRTLADAGAGSPQIIQPGYPPEDKTGSPVETILLGVLFGLILGVGLALLREQMDRRLHRRRRGLRRLRRAGAHHRAAASQAQAQRPFGELPADVAEAFRMLQMNLRFGPGAAGRAACSSPPRAAGEGKTTVAWNLACAAASARSLGHARRGGPASAQPGRALRARRRARAVRGAARRGADRQRAPERLHGCGRARRQRPPASAATCSWPAIRRPIRGR